MRDGEPCSGADVGVLDLDERARLGALAQDGPGAQVGERPDADAIADDGSVEVGVEDRRAVADLGVDQRAARADHELLRHRGHAVKTGERSDDRVLTDPHRASITVAAGLTTVTPRHVALVDRALGDRRHLGELAAVVDPAAARSGSANSWAITVRSWSRRIGSTSGR